LSLWVLLSPLIRFNKLTENKKMQNTELTLMEREALEIPSIIRIQLECHQQVMTELASIIRAKSIDGVVICGRGSSNNAAVFGKYLIETYMGLVVSLSAPSVASIYDASQNLNNKLFLVISQSGQSLDLIAAAKDAKVQGALVVALTNDESSPLANISDYLIPLMAGAESSVAATKTFVASLSSLLMLINEWTNDAKLDIALNELPDYLESCLQANWLNAVERFKTVKHTYVLGRGIGLAIAQEAALKLKETSHIFAEAYSVAEFMHGPLTTVSEGHPFLAFTQHDQTQQNTQESIERLSSIGAEILNVGGGNYEQNVTSLPLPTAPPPLCEPLGMISAFYPMAARLSIARGINPDEPPHIRKVTLTV